MAESENYRKGSEIRAGLMGEKYAAEMAKSVYDDLMMKKFGDYAREAVFGMLWSRPGLDLKTKALICVISDTAQARWPELAIHLRMARRQGWTEEDELSEALMHLCGYIGLPSVREATAHRQGSVRGTAQGRLSAMVTDDDKRPAARTDRPWQGARCLCRGRRPAAAGRDRPGERLRRW